MRPSYQDVVIISWYDGITEAFVREHDLCWRYASMVAFDPERRLRVFAIVRSDARTALSVREMCTSKVYEETKVWDEIRTRISKFLQTIEGDAELRLCKEIDGEIVMSRQIESKPLIGELGKEIEDCIGRSRFDFWISKFRATIEGEIEPKRAKKRSPE